jgi:hypothetical protein
MNLKFQVWCKNYNEWEKNYCLLGQDGKLYQLINGELQQFRPDTHSIFIKINEDTN